MTRYTLHLEPKPQSRPRFGRNGTYEDKDMKQWKRNCESQLRLMNPRIIEKGAISAAMTFYIYPPKPDSRGEKETLRTRIRDNLC